MTTRKDFQMNNEEIINLYNKYVITSYTRNPIAIVKGKGSWVWDANGKKYLDLFPGWGVNGLGHCHPNVIKAIKKQSKTLMHMPNNYYMEPQARLAELLIKNSFPGKCFFCNSGAEANESAIKLARKFGSQNGRYEIITCFNSFHGRTLTTITATAQPKYQEGFQPLVPGFKYVPFGDISATRKAISPQTIAIMIEPVQGEGGIQMAHPEFFQQLRILCNEQKLLLIFDEVQTGMGRTGEIFCFKNFCIEPDIITLAKALGSGPAIGAMIAKQHIQDVLTPGTHASTFGGNPLACSAAIAVFETIQKNLLLEKTKELGAYLKNQLLNIAKLYPSVIKEVRGIGLMTGVELYVPGAEIVKKCLEKGLIINCTHDTVLRIMPAMTVTKKELDCGLSILSSIIKEIKA
jgi:acetylornithine/N-succinyldiaminopimelate aminotransferase